MLRPGDHSRDRSSSAPSIRQNRSGGGRAACTSGARTRSSRPPLALPCGSCSALARGYVAKKPSTAALRSLTTVQAREFVRTRAHRLLEDCEALTIRAEPHRSHTRIALNLINHTDPCVPATPDSAASDHAYALAQRVGVP